jgi:hypothetical protein
VGDAAVTAPIPGRLARIEISGDAAAWEALALPTSPFHHIDPRALALRHAPSLSNTRRKQRRRLLRSTVAFVAERRARRRRARP